MTITPQPLPALYGIDETAWLDAMSSLAAEGRYAEMDFNNLSEFLSSMARRELREVTSRLEILLTHILKADHQSGKCSASWLGTIRAQRHRLQKLLKSGTLRNHAEAIFAEAYAEAREQASVETGLTIETFPDSPPYDLDAILAG